MSSFLSVKLPEYVDAKGALTVAELAKYFSWKPVRAYWVTKSLQMRGGHAHRAEHEFFVCIQGNIKARLHDGKEWHEFDLRGPGDALVVPATVWHEFDHFSEDAVLFALSSIPYDNGKGYIVDFDEFLKAVL